MKSRLLLAFALCFALNNLRAADTNAPAVTPVTNIVIAPYILTPPAPATPRINGANVFGVRPRSPFLFTIPATGERPMEFSSKILPLGLIIRTNSDAIGASLGTLEIFLDSTNGQMSGSIVTSKCEYKVTLQAKNS